MAGFVPRVGCVPADEVTTVAARHLEPDRLTTLVVGDFERIGGDLAHLGLGEPVLIPLEAFC